MIDVWHVPLPEGGPVALEPCLSADESARSARFVFERDRARFIVAHTALRQILTRYTGEEPAAIRLAAAKHGKPYLADHPDIRFNLSHSGSRAIVAVARAREVGVDIETIRPDRSTEDIARRFFAPAEVRTLLATAPERRVRAFFNCWARKEAYIKARGEGLGIALDSFEVSLDESAVLLKAEDRERWSMCSLPVAEGYAAALVAEGSGWHVRQLNWPRSHPET